MRFTRECPTRTRTLLPLGGFYLATALLLFSQDKTPAPTLTPAQPSAQNAVLIKDRPGERAVIAAKAHKDLYAGNFDALEATHQDLLTTNARFPDGTSKLACFYGAIRKPWVENESYWQDHLKKLEAWRAAKPDSMVAPVAWADSMTSYAWFARGTDTADKVTADGWKLLADRLGQARKVLDDSLRAHQGKGLPPGWYWTMQTVALGQGWEHGEYDKLFDAAVAAYPGYEDFYFTKAYFLQTKWYGSPGEWEFFADAWDKKSGPELYARICWSAVGNFGYDQFFAQTQVSWPMMKQGFEGLEKKWPTSLWNLNAFCRFACAAKDKPTAKRLFDRIGDVYFSNIWGSIEDFKAAETWAYSAGP